MTSGTVRDVSSIIPIRRRSDAAEVATAVYDQLLALLRTLGPEDWSAPTECPGWDVTAVVGHLIGAARSNASLREFGRQQLYGIRHRGQYGGNALDAYNALQVREHGDAAPAEQISALQAIAPRAVAGRMRWSPFLRLVNAPVDQSGSTAPGMPTRENGGHLYDIVYTRDAWLHTVDIARATGRQPDLSHPCNPRLLEDVVAEWARRHGSPFELELTGPAGGRYRQGDGGQHLSLDAVEFARILSGRQDGTGLLATRVLF
jgi:uncharacterized protein (TIGR03083 family)